MLGNSISIYTSGTATSTNVKQVNKVTSSFAMGSNVINLIRNHNLKTLDNWELIKTGTSTETVGNSTSNYYMGNKSLKIGVASATNGSVVRYRQMLTNDMVVPGKAYTFFGYIKTDGLNPLVQGNYGAALLVYCYFADGTKKSFYSDFISGTNDNTINKGWRRQSVTFTVPSDAIKTSVNLIMKNANGNAYFDALQLEEGDVANDYNFLENVGFEDAIALYGWTGNGLLLDGSTDTTSSATYYDGKQSF